MKANAQTFRTVTHLSWRGPQSGLNLTRRTLCAVLKYPWMRRPADAPEQKRLGGYDTRGSGGLRHRTGGFLFATEGRDELPGQTLEAAIMDWADDITYAVHDLEDFYRAGLTPIARLHNDDLEKDLFIARSTTSLQKYE